MQVGSTFNMRMDLENVDLAGIWWMKDASSGEKLVSFADGEANSTDFPFEFAAPTGGYHMWSYDDGPKAALTMLLSALVYKKPGNPMRMIFDRKDRGRVLSNKLETSQFIKADAASISYMNDNQWYRKYAWNPKSVFFFRSYPIFNENGGDYELTRIVDGRGQPVQPHWDEWLRHMESKRLLTWNTDSWCGRMCFSFLHLADFTQTLDPCPVCNMVCSSEEFKEKEEVKAPPDSSTAVPDFDSDERPPVEVLAGPQ